MIKIYIKAPLRHPKSKTDKMEILYVLILFTAAYGYNPFLDNE
ncbi:hypothetical protein ACMC5R_01080 [Deferribacteres bacterium DY0037]|nr:hypothetical protein [Denitrovibrio acetiphilus]